MLGAKTLGIPSLVASDGPVLPEKEKGCYGWVIAIGDDNGVGVMGSKGQASGSPMAPSRAGAYGAWSLLLTVARLFECYKKDPSKMLRMLCDNKGLVGKVNEILCQKRR